MPVILGMILMEPMEQNLRRALGASGGEWWILFGSPLALGLHLVTAGFIGFAVFREIQRRMGQGRAAHAQAE